VRGEGILALVNVTKRVQIEGKGWRFCEVVVAANGKIKPNVVRIDGQEQVHPEGRYYIDFLQDGQRKRLAAGASAAEAGTAADKQTRILTAHKAATAAGISLPQAKPPAGSRLLRDAVNAYLLEVQAHKKPKTYSAYRTALNYFLESCHKVTLEEITRTDLLAFKTFLRHKKEQSDRSIANKFENVMSFLKQQKIIGLIGKTTGPRSQKRKSRPTRKRSWINSSPLALRPRLCGLSSFTGPLCVSKRSCMSRGRISTSSVRSSP